MDEVTRGIMLTLYNEVANVEKDCTTSDSNILNFIWNQRTWGMRLWRRKLSAYIGPKVCIGVHVKRRQAVVLA